MTSQLQTTHVDATERPFICPHPGNDPQWDREWQLVETARHHPDWLTAWEWDFLNKVEGRLLLTQTQRRRLFDTFRKIHSIAAGSL